MEAESRYLSALHGPQVSRGVGEETVVLIVFEP